MTFSGLRIEPPPGSAGIVRARTTRLAVPLARRAVSVLALVALSVAGCLAAPGLASAAASSRAFDELSRIRHVVVVFQENHSFDNLFGAWEGVNGLARADIGHTLHVGQAGVPFACLRQVDINLAALAPTCTDATTPTTCTPSSTPTACR